MIFQVHGIPKNGHELGFLMKILLNGVVSSEVHQDMLQFQKNIIV